MQQNLNAIFTIHMLQSTSDGRQWEDGSGRKYADGDKTEEGFRRLFFL